MKDWIPFLKSLVWPVFITIILIWARKWFKETLEAIKERIKQGSELRVGREGIVVGTAPKLESEDKTELLTKAEAQIAKKESAEEEMLLELKQSIYLIHTAKPDREIEGRLHYNINAWLDADSHTIMNKVSKVVYYLHPTFPEPIRENTNRRSNFELVTLAWGQFNLRADVYFEDREKPLTLFRYLNF